MPQTKILLDSTSYFRLARSIRPLLFQEFGPDTCCLYVLKDLDDEFDHNPRLQTKFSWVNDAEYKNNRQTHLSCSRKEKASILQTAESLFEYSVDVGRGISRVDASVIAHGQVLGITIVSDDADLITTAADASVQALSSLELMELMLRHGHINIEKVREIAAYWIHERDTPANFRSEYERLFKEKPSA